MAGTRPHSSRFKGENRKREIGERKQRQFLKQFLLQRTKELGQEVAEMCSEKRVFSKMGEIMACYNAERNNAGE